MTIYFHLDSNDYESTSSYYLSILINEYLGSNCLPIGMI